ncbi:MAG: diguanylate cyclase [Clostridiaceae bacterium]
MYEIEKDKRKKINDIISVVKLSSLLFLGIVLLKSMSGLMFDYYNISVVLAVVFFFTLVYGGWAFSTNNNMNNKYKSQIQIVESALFILIFTGLIIYSGANTSDYKYLFLFIIITSNIQYGIKHGMTVAIVSSIIILGMDLIYLPNVQVNTYFENDLIMSGVFILTSWPLGFYVKIEGEHIEKLLSMANEDALTQVYNHRYFRDSLKEIVNSSKDNNKNVSMAMIDIDYFKYYNDLYGHQKGDEVLKKIGEILKKNVREEDIVARYGGEEFAIIFPDTNEDEALEISEKIRNEVEKTYFDGEENQPNGKLTISMGVSVFPEKARDHTELLKSSDDALYRAKFFEKNRVEIYTSILDELKNDIEEEHIDLITSFKTLISVINAKDRYTYGHVERVVIYCRLLADKVGLSEERKKELIYGAYMHDIGKINIPKEVLNKKMPLTEDEWEILKQHPVNGVEIINPVKSLKNISPVILYHHERYDGKGYPCALKGKEIPYLARLLTVVDSFDAMTSDRPYNKRKTYEEGIEELIKCKNSQFDPEIVDAFIHAIRREKINDDLFKCI